MVVALDADYGQTEIEMDRVAPSDLSFFAEKLSWFGLEIGFRSVGLGPTWHALIVVGYR